MAKKRYTMHFTDVTLRMIQSLEKRGYMIRQIVNAGVVLFHQADMAKRGQATAIAHGMLKEELCDILEQIQETVEWMESIKQKEEVFTREEIELAQKIKSIQKQPKGPVSGVRRRDYRDRCFHFLLGVVDFFCIPFSGVLGIHLGPDCRSFFDCSRTVAAASGSDRKNFKKIFRKKLDR